MNPDKYTIAEHYIDVGDGHQLYVQDWGLAAAKKPIMYLHGGPGSGIKDKNKLLFDPLKQRVIFFDQRGSGKSLPTGSLTNNTTKELVEDIVKVAQTCKVKSFILVGGSWGAALSLVFGIAHPDMVEAMVLSGVFTGSRKEIEWVDSGGYRAIFPDVWEKYVASTPKEHQDKPSAYHYKQALHGSGDLAKFSAYAYGQMEYGVMQIDDRPAIEDYETFDPSGSRIEMHYLSQGCFLPDRHVFKNASKLTMPIYIVQGRYDMVCPPVTAYELSKKLSDARIFWTVNGHRAEHESWNLQRSILGDLTR